jgi:hypothetical protein
VFSCDKSLPAYGGIFFVIKLAIALHYFSAMIVINIDKVRQEAAAKAIHKPEIRIIMPEVHEQAESNVSDEIVATLEKKHESDKRDISLKDALINDLNNQERDLRIERAKLSNKYLPMIEVDASMDELAHHYRKIEAISDEIRDVYNKREHVLRFGRLPENGSAQKSIDHTNILALKEQRRSLNNRIHKTQKKITLGKAKKSPKLTDWQLYLDKMEAEREVVISRIKELSYE